MRHGEFRTPHALAFDGGGRLWVADRGNRRIEIFDQNGTYLESRYMFGRPSGLFIRGDMVCLIDSESSPYNHPNWRDGVRVGPVDEDLVTGFIPPFERDDRVYPGRSGRGRGRRCRRQRLRRRSAEFDCPSGWSVHEVLRRAVAELGASS